MISVIIPSYNRAQILPRAINSVLTQSFQDFEVIVVDDGSIDDTENVVLSINDARVKYLYQENKGVCVARNHGISVAKGNYLVFLDSDDYVTNHWLADFHEKILNTSSDIVFCDVKMVQLNNSTEKKIRALYPFKDDSYDEFGLYLAGAFCIKNIVLKEIGGFDEKIKFGEFTELSFRCMKISLSKSFTEKLGLIYEVTENGGGSNSANKIESNLYIIQKHAWFFEKQPNGLRLYLQNIAISYCKLNEFKKARMFFWKAYCINPRHIKTLIRLVISFFPDLAKKVLNKNI